MSDIFRSMDAAAIKSLDREQPPVKDLCSAAVLPTTFPANRASWNNGSPGIGRRWCRLPGFYVEPRRQFDTKL